MKIISVIIQTLVIILVLMFALSCDLGLPSGRGPDVSDTPGSPAAHDIPAFSMKPVPAGTYTIPTGTDDSGRAEVPGGFEIGETEVTYELWYAVRIWAEASGYNFENPGREGSGGSEGQAPTAAAREPVTEINWHDCVVWCNALSEMDGKDPVYRTASGEIIRDSRDNNTAVVDAAIQTANNGYRLPTSNEWELAARYIDGTNWTPGNYASGATANSDNADATKAVAVYMLSPLATDPDNTADVKTKAPNALGLYDMSGNVWEWTFTAEGSNRVYRGGGWGSFGYAMQVGDVYSYIPYYTHFYGGLRLVRD